MRRAGVLGLCCTTASAGSATDADGLEEVKPQDFFPKSAMPGAMRERLAGRLLGRIRITDPAFDDYYQRVSSELSPGDDFLAVTANSDDINAFAHFGGLIVMMRGMWEFAESEDALLGILAHEMGHVKLDHFESKRKLDDAVSAATIPILLAGLLVGDSETRESILIGGSGIITGQIYGHSRELEHEADVLGLKLLTQSGRDGRQISALLGRLAGANNEYISTHPAPRRRAAYIKDRLFGHPQFESTNSLEFLLLREKLSTMRGATPEFIAAKQRDLSLAEGGDLRTALQLSIFLSAAALPDRALAEETASQLSQVRQPIIIAELSEYALRNKEPARALSILKPALSEFPQSSAIAVKTAQVLRRAGQHRELLKWQASLPQEMSSRSDILRETSQSASHLGKNAEANILLTRAHMATGEFELANRQLEIASKFKMSTNMLVQSNKLQNQIKGELSAIASVKEG